MPTIQDLRRPERTNKNSVLAEGIRAGTGLVSTAIQAKQRAAVKGEQDKDDYFERYEKALLSAKTTEKRQVIQKLHQDGKYSDDPRGQQIADTIGGAGASTGWHKKVDSHLDGFMDRFNKAKEDSPESASLPSAGYKKWEDTVSQNVGANEEEIPDVLHRIRTGLIQRTGVGEAGRIFEELGIEIAGLEPEAPEAQPEAPVPEAPVESEGGPGILSKALGGLTGMAPGIVDAGRAGLEALLGGNESPEAPPQEASPLAQGLTPAPAPIPPLGQGIQGSPDNAPVPSIEQPPVAPPSPVPAPQAQGSPDPRKPGVPQWYGALQNAPTIPAKIKSEVEKKRAEGMEWEEILALMQTHLPEVYKVVASQGGI